MRILHLADLHLGKLVHEAPMTEDQAHVLHQVLAMVREKAVDVVAISGDVYDRAIPPVAATRLMDWFLSELVLDLGVAVILTPGNHDSAERLSFGSRLLSARGLHIAPGLPGEITPLVLADAHGPVTFIPLPYITPLMLKEREEDLATGDFNEAMARVMSRVMAALPRMSGRSVCLAHCFTLGGSASESERPLSIGGSCLVDPAHFAPFSLTLLGHLHRPQKVAERAFYAGSPLKYSFSEADHQKSAALYELDADGGFTRTLLPLIPRRDMRKISGGLDELLAAAEADPGREDYLWIELTDRGALFDYAAKLRQSYPNVLSITRAQYGREDGGVEGGISVRGKTEWEITTAFFRHVSGQGLDEAEEDALRAVVEEMLRAEALGETAEMGVAGHDPGQPGETKTTGLPGKADAPDTPGAAARAAAGEVEA